jgi:hypothetical protein
MRTGMELSMNHMFERTSYGSNETWWHWSIKRTFRNRKLDTMFEAARLATMLEF